MKKKITIALIILLTIVTRFIVVEASDTGVVDAGTGANETSVGDTAWSPTTGPTYDDGSTFSQYTTPGGSVPNTSNYLVGSNFGFAIPAGATINGVTVTAFVDGGIAAAVFKEANIKLFKAGAPTGNNKANGATSPPSSGADVTWGSSSDVWGATLTADDVNNSGFGFALSYTGNSVTVARTMNVQDYRVTIHYTEAPAVPEPIIWFNED